MKKKAYILYLEDERDTIELVGQILSQSGCKVTGATSGKQGLVMMRAHKPDLLLLDLVMHDMSGWEVYREMKQDKDLANIPVIVISAETLNNDLSIFEDLPLVDDYIPKPFTSEQLIRTVKKFIKE